ncbi:MAG TPA: hypothetical protein VNF74_14190 [Terriglobales bacterium]|nr:hypothetical protein [Terriglobales bacterium]
MTEMIVTHPADAGRIAKFEPEALRLQAELRAIESLANGNCCRVCGEERPLSFEHTPSRSAGNRAPAIQYSVDEATALSSGVIT